MKSLTCIVWDPSIIYTSTNTKLYGWVYKRLPICVPSKVKKNLNLSKHFGVSFLFGCFFFVNWLQIININSIKVILLFTLFGTANYPTWLVMAAITLYSQSCYQWWGKQGWGGCSELFLNSSFYVIRWSLNMFDRGSCFILRHWLRTILTFSSSQIYHTFFYREPNLIVLHS